ncbi:succinate dehydrogenase cytochrome b subunit [Schaalia canis]|uniref:Succinate dehydrogenase cytochrome b subunit n=1 Tax=Schaalia canis TaxID=100469 RepID=A0A3P1SCV9_9ACTO|nr:succinate dehydrogenase cytochrome b subunit [Schaalia canis]RRC95131.1 succinate dehydrogenase cytochrome b subunit [Schaalia canis]
MAHIHGQYAVARRSVVLPTWLLKTATAVTGMAMAAFVLVHMLGNLKVFLDPQGVDLYAAWLREVGAPALPHGMILWAFRIVMVGCLIIHLGAVLILWQRSASTRTRGARRMAWRGYGAKAMMPTGIIMLLFISAHILDLTAGVLIAPESFQHPTPSADGGSVFHAVANLSASLARPLAAIGYGAALIALGIHLAHGIGLAWQDLGGVNERGRRIARLVGYALALAIVAGNGAVILGAWMGVFQ